MNCLLIRIFLINIDPVLDLVETLSANIFEEVHVLIGIEYFKCKYFTHDIADYLGMY